MTNKKQEIETSCYSILFVDDERLARHYFNRICKLDFNVITAKSADEALDILKNNHEKIAVLLTDRRMPELPGIQLLKIVQNLYPDIVRMLTTGYIDIGETIHSIVQAEVLDKPWDVEKLRCSLFDAMRLYFEQKQP